MKIAVFYFLGALALAGIGFFLADHTLKFLLLWTALSLLLVSIAYCFNLARIFRKKQNGIIPWYIKILFVPFLIGVNLINIRQRRNDKVPAIQKVDTHLYLACRLMRPDIETLQKYNISAVLDVTCEFDALNWSLQGENFDYLNIPILDHAVPSQAQLREAINWIHRQIKLQRSVVVHCALGRGRSVMVMAAYLLSQNPSLSLEDVHDKIQLSRETANLNPRQFNVLKRRHKLGQIAVQHRLAIIANPQSGSQSWATHRKYIEKRLSVYFDLTVYETTPEQRADYFAEKALETGADIIVACGGDGTITEVAGVLAGSNISLGIIPLGTANALAHVLHGISSKIIPIEQACDVLIQGIANRIDTAKVNGQLMLLLTGFGFEQSMIEDADRESKNELGQLAYLKGFWQALSENKELHLRLQIDQQEPLDIKTSSLVIANAAPFSTLLAQGAGEPDFTDGLLDITYIDLADDLPLSISIAELAFKALTQARLEGYIEHEQASSVKVTADGPIKYAIDGEIFESEEVLIEIEPKSLSVLVPEAGNNDTEET